MEFTSEHFYATALREIPGIGDVTARELVLQSGSAENIFQSKTKDFENFITDKNWIKNFFYHKTESLRRAELILKDCERLGIQIVLFNENSFPSRLYYLNDAPFLIYFRGRPEWNAEYSLGIVGTRRPDGYGKKITEQVVEGMLPYAPLIVSGMALGIDGYAHFTALRYGLRTIGVMGHGLDRIYPSLHQKLSEEILISGGALLSEFPPGTRPEPQYFPRRNRIVAGISDAVVVVQSRTKGGSMITASIAHSYNKDVFAVPGPVDEPLSEGPNGLIKMNKATLIENAEDIAYFMNWKTKTMTTENNSCKEKAFQTSIPLCPEDESFMSLRFKKRKWMLEEIMQELGWPYSKVAGRITHLELNGFVMRHAGNLLEFL